MIAGLALAPGAADGLTWLAFVAIPPLAALALGWAMRGARPWLAVLVVPLLAVPMIVVNQSHPFVDPAVADACAVILSALSCVTLGRLLAAVAPTWALEAGIVAMATIDAILVFSHGLQQPNSVLVTAVPSVSGFDLPRLQVANFDFAQIGYGDLFIAGVLGGVVAVRHGPAVCARAVDARRDAGLRSAVPGARRAAGDGADRRRDGRLGDHSLAGIYGQVLVRWPPATSCGTVTASRWRARSERTIAGSALTVVGSSCIRTIDPPRSPRRAL